MAAEAEGMGMVPMLLAVRMEEGREPRSTGGRPGNGEEVIFLEERLGGQQPCQGPHVGTPDLQNRKDTRVVSC